MRHAMMFMAIWMGCGGDGQVAREDASAADSTETVQTTEVDSDLAEVVTVPSSFRWDLAAVGPADFYAYPWPSTLRVNASGAPDLVAFPTDKAQTTILGDAIHAVETGPAGFSPLASAYFGLDVDLDPATLEDQVWLVDLDRRERLSANVEWNAEGGGYWPARTLALHADYQIPPRAGAHLAAVVLDGVRTMDGEALIAPSVFATLDHPDSDEARALATALPALEQLGLRAHVVAFTTWQASDPMAELRALADWVHTTAPPSVSDVALVVRAEAYDQYQGNITLTEAFSGEPPYSQAFGDGLIVLNADGSPKTPRAVTIPFTLTVPRAEMPDDGFPLVLYGHGLGETHEGFLRTAAAPLGARGVAVIGLDPPLQGTRNTTSTDDRTLIVTLSIANIVGGREILRQGVLDYLQLARAVPNVLVPAGVAPDGSELRFDAARLGFFGHSEGAQIGALLLPLEPALGPAVFSEGGGGAAITMLALKLQEIDVSQTVAEFLGVNRAVEAWQLGHPLVTAVIQPVLDQADPLYLARNIIREPDGAPHDLVMLEGFLDPLTPPPSMEALASAIGLPIAEPVGRPIAGLDAQAIASVALPASGNVAVGETSVTAALLQLPEEDHYIIYFNDAVKTRLMDFLAKGLAGDARFE